MKFSVAMCVYHKDDSHAFMQAFNSVTKQQTLSPDEVVIVVDGPIYGDLQDTINECAKNDYVKLIRLDENLGHARARQKSIEEASNDIIAIMDADDIAIPNRFEKQINYLKCNSGVAVLGGQISEFIDTPENIIGYRIVPTEHCDIEKRLESRCPFNQVSVMLLRSAVMAVGGYKDWYCNEDYYLWLRLAIAEFKFANLKEVLVNVRVGKEMYKRRGGWKYFKSEARLQGYMMSHNIISPIRYLYNVFGRFVIQVVLPNNIRSFVFQKLFRK